jgi:predicted nucleotidyltransferase component of viral defense system
VSGWHLDILGARQRKALIQLAPFCEQRDFYLAGGTALALQLGHRKSVDLDWFTTDRLSNPLDLAHDLGVAGIPVHVTTVAPGTLHSQLSGVRVTVLHDRYRPLRPLRFCRLVGCHVAACDDIAAMKLAAITQCGARRDFVDLWALLESGISLRQMLRLPAEVPR